MTTIYLSSVTFGSSKRVVNAYFTRPSNPDIPALVAYPHYADLPALRQAGNWRLSPLMIDSGAYSVQTTKCVVNLQNYINFLHTEHGYSEYVALDVIGDAMTSMRNFLRMKEAGLNPIPVWHVGEPWSVLHWYAERADKVGIGGCVGQPLSITLPAVEQVFAHIWPKKIHGFGLTRKEFLTAFPFHSVDSTTWCNAVRFGNYMYKNRHVNLCARRVVNMDEQVLHVLRLQDAARARWRRELDGLNHKRETTP